MAGAALTGGGVRLEELTHKFAHFTLGPLSVELENGVTALLGENGAGKTTLMRAMVGVLRPDGGSVDWRLGAPKGGAGYLPQEFAPWGRFTAHEYLEFVAWARSTRADPIEPRAIDTALASVGLTELAHRRVRELSGGMVRRLGIAQSLIGSTSGLVLDEPTVGLDPMQRRGVRELIRELGAERMVLVSTHLVEDVVAIADRLLVLHHGEQVYLGPPSGMCDGESPTAEALESGLVRLLSERRPETHD
ncbi:ABC transporter ATP-binding protein [Demequina sp.]|uniref:ABC transporter ATP-binding protein n=1 Tax=Demequina sp. TaxID=2050685 RepID=UPI003A8885E5